MSIIDSLVEVALSTEDDFLKVKETLTRIGVASRKDRKLQQLIPLILIYKELVEMLPLLITVLQIPE